MPATELRSCVKVEVAVLGSPALIVLTVSVDVKQHRTMPGSRVKVGVAVLGSPPPTVLTVSVDVKQHWTWTWHILRVRVRIKEKDTSWICPCAAPESAGRVLSRHGCRLVPTAARQPPATPRWRDAAARHVTRCCLCCLRQAFLPHTPKLWPVHYNSNYMIIIKDVKVIIIITTTKMCL